MRSGAAALGQVAHEAVARLVGKGTGRSTWKVPLSARELFTPAERDVLGRALAATLATSQLLGRARIRRRAEQARRHHERFAERHAFAEVPTDLSCFAEPIHPLAPKEALEYFLSLIPLPGIQDPGKWGDDLHRVAFTLARATEDTLLARVQEVIADRLRNGQRVSDAPRDIDAVLDEAGVSPRNPQYAEMVFRTNMMDSYQQGSHEEQKAAADDFPAWEWLGIRDGRERPRHAQHFGRYYPADTSLAAVRDREGYDGYNCRCSSRPVYKTEWEQLQKGGAAFSSFAEAPVAPVRQQKPWTCGPAALVAVARGLGIDAREPEVARLAGADPDDGTPPPAMVAAAREMGLDVEERPGMGVPEIVRQVILGRPVIVCAQAWGGGHWMVAAQWKGGRIGFEDPARSDGLTRWTPEELAARWHDTDGEGKPYDQYGIVVKGRLP